MEAELIHFDSGVRREFLSFSNLANISNLMGSGTPVTQLIDEIFKALQEAIEYDNILLYVNPQYEKGIINNQTIGFSDAEIAFFNNTPIYKWMESHREPLLIIEELRDFELCRPDIKSLINIPLKTRGKFIGMVQIRRLKPNKNFNVNNLELANIYGAKLSFYIENTRLTSEYQDKIRELNRLNEISEALNSELDMERVFNKIVDSLASMINIDSGSFFYVRNGKGTLVITSSRNLTTDYIQKLCSKNLSDYQEKTGKKPESIEIISRISHNPGEEVSDFTSFLTGQLVVKGEILGFLGVAHREDGLFTADNHRTLSMFASQASVAIQNARIYEDLEKRLVELKQIFEMSQKLTSTFDAEHLLDMVVEMSLDLMGADFGQIRILDEKVNRVLIKDNFSFKEVSDNSIYDDFRKNFLKEIYETGESICIDDIYEFCTDKCSQTAELLRANDINCAHCVRLEVGEKKMGTLNVFYKNKNKYREEDIILLKTLGAFVAIALDNARLYNFMEESFLDTISALSNAIEAKDHYTHDHSQMVMQYALAIANEMNLSKEDKERIKFAGLLHDVGKIGISEYILTKTSRLTDEEYQMIQNHPEYGNRILQKVELLRQISPLTYHHHEKYDGTGYPDKLKGDEIPLGARILAVADTFDAITSDRSYRKGQSREYALEEIKRCAGTQFDPQVVNAFAKAMEKTFESELQINLESIGE